MRPALVLCLLLVPLVALAGGKKPKSAKPAPQAEKKADAPWRYALTYRTSPGLTLTVLLNDVVLLEEDGKQAGSGQLDVNDWVMPGANALQVRIKQADPRAKLDFFETYAEVKLVGFEKPEEVFDAKPLAFLDLGARKGRLPVDERYTVQVTHPTPSQLWTKAARLTLDEATRQAALQLAGELYAAYVKKDAATLATLSLFKVTDGNRARQWSDVQLPALESAIAEGIKSVQVPPLKPEELTIQLVAGGKVLWVSRAGKPFLSWKEEDGESSVDLFVANVDGRWTVAR